METVRGVTETEIEAVAGEEAGVEEEEGGGGGGGGRWGGDRGGGGGRFGGDRGGGGSSLKGKQPGGNLRPVNWDRIDLKPFEKNFYNATSASGNMDQRLVEQFR